MPFAAERAGPADRAGAHGFPAKAGSDGHRWSIARHGDGGHRVSPCRPSCGHAERARRRIPPPPLAGAAEVVWAPARLTRRHRRAGPRPVRLSRSTRRLKEGAGMTPKRTDQATLVRRSLTVGCAHDVYPVRARHARAALDQERREQRFRRSASDTRPAAAPAPGGR
jgi:hypothetical protein